MEDSSCLGYAGMEAGLLKSGEMPSRQRDCACETAADVQIADAVSPATVVLGVVAVPAEVESPSSGKPCHPESRMLVILLWTETSAVTEALAVLLVSPQNCDSRLYEGIDLQSVKEAPLSAAASPVAD